MYDTEQWYRIEKYGAYVLELYMVILSTDAFNQIT